MRLRSQAEQGGVGGIFKKVQESRTSIMRSEEHRLKISMSIKRKWADPQYRDKQVVKLPSTSRCLLHPRSSMPASCRPTSLGGSVMLMSFTPPPRLWGPIEVECQLEACRKTRRRCAGSR